MKKITSLLLITVMLLSCSIVFAKPKEKEPIKSIVVDDTIIANDGDTSITFDVYVHTFHAYVKNTGNSTVNFTLDRLDASWNFSPWRFTLKPGEDWESPTISTRDINTGKIGGLYKLIATSTDGSPLRVLLRVRQHDEN